MRISIFVLVLCASLISMGMAHAEDKDAMPEEINMSEPPFWMASYDEFKDLQKFQKDYYLEKLGPELRKVPSLEEISDSKIQEAGEWYRDWNIIMRKLYVACRDKSLEATCAKVAKVRIDALNAKSNWKSEKKIK